MIPLAEVDRSCRARSSDVRSAYRRRGTPRLGHTLAGCERVRAMRIGVRVNGARVRVPYDRQLCSRRSESRRRVGGQFQDGFHALKKSLGCEWLL